MGRFECAKSGDELEINAMTPPARVEITAFVATSVAGAWLSASLPVFAQEAYYWTYAQHPDLSYFDHPPMVGWLIWLGTQVLGDGTLGVRLGTWVAACATTLLGRALLCDFAVGVRGRVAWMLASIGVPAFAATHFLANPDPPLVAFWMLTLLMLWRARHGDLCRWLIAGAAAGSALLSKYTAVFLGCGGLIVFAVDREMRTQLRRPGPYLGVLAAAAAFLPVLIWNAHHEFESFRFQTSNRLAVAELRVGSLLECVGQQMLMLNPVLAMFVPVVVVWLAKRVRRDRRALWLLAFGVPLPACMLAASLWIQVKMNWLTPGYVAVALGGAMWWDKSGWIVARTRWRRAAAIAVAVMFVGLPLSPAIRLLPVRSGTSWIGWDEIAARAEYWEEQVDQADGIEGNFFFFCADYKDASQLGRALRLAGAGDSEHVLEPTLAQNVVGECALQFDHWVDPTERIGQDAVFVLPRADQRRSLLERTRPYFDSIDRVDEIRINRLGIAVFDADVYVCRRYHGAQAQRKPG